MNKLFLFITVFFLGACKNEPKDATTEPSNETAAAPMNLTYTVTNVYPHDTTSFTQGLLVHNGKLYEGTGGNPQISHYQSWVGIVNLKTGKPEKQVKLDKMYFGEGITILNHKLYQLTWNSRKGFIYDAYSLAFEKEFPLKTEGWGIVNDGKWLIVSDGSSNLYFLNPETFNTEKVLSVNINGTPVGNINEMEWIEGFIYANKWQSDDILKIDPENGKVMAIANMTGLLKQYAPEYTGEEKYNNGEGVLNGIAWDSTSNKIYITGKLWPKLFEIKFN